MKSGAHDLILQVMRLVKLLSSEYVEDLCRRVSILLSILHALEPMTDAHFNKERQGSKSSLPLQISPGKSALQLGRSWLFTGRADSLIWCTHSEPVSRFYVGSNLDSQEDPESRSHNSGLRYPYGWLSKLWSLCGSYDNTAPNI